MGRITVRKALMLSRNVPAVKIGKAVGIENVIETARLAGVTTRLDPNLSLSLGSSAVTPLDMAGAYATFARGGIAIKPQVLRRIENNRGQIIEAFEPRVDKVFDTDAVAQLVSVLQDVVRAGTGTAAKLGDRPVAGKTGTADAGKDIWFCGFTPDTVTAVWGGNDENLPIPGHNVTGGVVMAKIWKDFMSAYYQMRPTPPGSFITPTKKIDDLGEEQSADATDDGTQMPKLIPIDPNTGAAVYDGTEATPGTAPTTEGAPPPAVSPATAIPTTDENGATRYETPPVQQPAVQSAPVPAPAPAPAPNVVPVVPMPAPAGPLGQAPTPSIAPAAMQYSSGNRYTPPTVVVNADGRTKKTIINEEPVPRYSSLTDPTYSPGLHKKRFAPGGTSPTPAGF